jgi:hypothetical protein
LGTDNYLEATFAARGEERYVSEWHGEAGSRDADSQAVLRFYDGRQFNVFNTYFRRYEITTRFAVPPFTDKIRSHAFMEVLGWWPAADRSPPPRQDVTRSFWLREALANAALRVAPLQQKINGHWCHVVADDPPCDRLWIDSALGVVRRRELLSTREAGDPLVTFSLDEFQRVDGVVWLPYRMRRIYHPANYDIVLDVHQYVVNNTPEDRFTFMPPPGTLIYDRDTDTSSQVPGGFATMENVSGWIDRALADGAPSRKRSANALADAGLVCFGAVLYWTFRVNGRSRQGDTSRGHKT